MESRARTNFAHPPALTKVEIPVSIRQRASAHRYHDQSSPTAVADHPQAQGESIGRVALACCVGTAVEYYDFFIYGTAAALAFPAVFFPNLSTTMATVASMGTFAAAFVSRPLGAAFFGHFGDRLGRKVTLIATLLIMGLSTIAVGLTPSAAQIGVAAPLIVLTLRLIQGFAVGGEWAGSALLGAEYAPPSQRGHYGMFTAIGVGISLVLASLTFLGVDVTIGETSPAFIQWGWRVPFLLSVALVAIALFVRVHIDDTPVFRAQQARNKPARAPIAEVIRQKRGVVALVSGSFVAGFAFVFMAGTFLTNLAHRVGFSRETILVAGVLGGLAWIAAVPLSANLCDQVGRRPIMLWAWILGLPWSFAVIPLIESGHRSLLTLAIVGTYVIAAFASAPLPSFVPELFATRHRYTAAGLAQNLAGVVGGGLPPLMAEPLLTRCGGWTVGLVLTTLVALTLACISRLPETNGTSLHLAGE